MVTTRFFDWHLIDGAPLYFFRRGARFGISYNSRILPVSYHDILHGYCCGEMANNPHLGEHSLRFYARRDGVWYYVIIESGT